MGQILLNIQMMKTAIILTFLGLSGSLTDACCKHGCNNGNTVNVGLGRMGSEITDDTVEPLAYAVCNTDGVEGLSWPEVDLCEAMYCKDLPFDCPTEADFDFFDADGNGIRTKGIYPWRVFHSAQVRIPFPSASKKSKSASVGQSKGRSLQYIASHRSTSAQESPSTPSVLQTAYAKGSTVSSVISEPILPRPTFTVLLLLQPCLQQASVKEPNNPKKVKMIAVFIVRIFKSV